jgi:ABC-type glycerol-3-phosphate transport system substrate-binding protein
MTATDEPAPKHTGSWLSRRKLLVGAFFGTVIGGTVGAEGLHWASGQEHHSAGRPGQSLQVYGGQDSNQARQNALQVWKVTPSTEKADLQFRYHDVGASSTDQFTSVENLLAKDPQSADLIIVDPEYLPELVSRHQIKAFERASSTSLRDLGCFPGIVDRCEVGRKLYSVPLNADAPMLVVDVSLLADADRRALTSLTEQPDPATFWSTAASMAKRSVGRPETRKILLQTGNYEGMTVCLVELIRAFGGNVSADPTLTDVRNRSALQALRTTFGSQTFTLPADKGDEAATLSAVQHHQTAFARLWPAQCHDLTTGSVSDEANTVQYQTIPVPGGVLGGQVLAVGGWSTNSQESAQLANYLSQPLSQLQLFHDGGYVPTLRQIHADRQVVSELKGLGDRLGSATVRPSLANYTGWSQQFRTSVRSYLVGGTDDVARDITGPLREFVR